MLWEKSYHKGIQIRDKLINHGEAPNPETENTKQRNIVPSETHKKSKKITKTCNSTYPERLG